MQTSEQVLSNLTTELLSPIYQAVVGITILYFLYGVMKYIIDINNPEKAVLGKSHLLYGTIGLFIVLSVGGILKYMSEIFSGMFK